LHNSFLENFGLELKLTGDGVISFGKSNFLNRIVDYVITTAEVAARIGAAFGPGGASHHRTKRIGISPRPRKKFGTS
jgi:hypothetical protein